MSSCQMSVSEERPDLAVVVLAVGAPDEVADALASLDQQTVPLEIVLVNSGGGDLKSIANPVGPKLRVVSKPEILWPGAARNLGIENSKARWVAFLASDHIARNDWAERRLEMHRAGHRSVASAVINSNPRSLVAWAHHLAILVRRLPGVPPEEAHLYGVSYDRQLFDQFGVFRPDLRIGEDTEFNQRLGPDDQPVWAPSVQVSHRNATRISTLLQDQFRRGRRYGFHWRTKGKARIWTRVYNRFVGIVTLSYVSVKGIDRLFVVACWPILLFAVTAYEFGVRAGIRDKQRPSAEPN